MVPESTEGTDVVLERTWSSCERTESTGLVLDRTELLVGGVTTTRTTTRDKASGCRLHPATFRRVNLHQVGPSRGRNGMGKQGGLNQNMYGDA